MIFQVNVKCGELLNNSSLSGEDIYSNYCPHYCHLRVPSREAREAIATRDFIGIPLHGHQV
jgi:hypothetical protein